MQSCVLKPGATKIRKLSYKEIVIATRVIFFLFSEDANIWSLRNNLWP